MRGAEADDPDEDEFAAREYMTVERYIGEAFEKYVDPIPSLSLHRDGIRYNSNHFTLQLLLSRRTRETPDAFSHFTFERSGERLMVADIQVFVECSVADHWL